MKAIPAIGLSLLFGCQWSPPTSSEDWAYADFSNEAAPATSTAADDTLMPAATTRGLLSESPAEGPAPTPEAAAGQAEGVERQVIYSAALHMVVVSAQESFASIRSIAQEAGGYLQESNSEQITIRVPAKSFDAVIEAIALLGELVDREIRASDVTEEMLDLDIRLDNARKARERLLEHLAESEDIEVTLKIEAELTRVTGEIERIEGRLRYMRSQIAMSTIRVRLNVNQPQASNTGLLVPFEWITQLGDGLIAGTVRSMPRKPRFLARGPRFEPPADFVRYFSASDLVEAMNASGIRIKVRKHENFDEGALRFWSQLARKTLVEGRSLAVTKETDLSKDQHLLAGTREVGRASLGYMLVLTRTDGSVHTFEAWGPSEELVPLHPDLIKSAKSLRR